AMDVSREYHYRKREMRIERTFPVELPALMPPPEPCTSSNVYYVRTEVERSPPPPPPPPKKRVVFIEVEKPAPPPPPPKERVVLIRVERSAPPPPPPRPLYEEIMGNDIMMKSMMPQELERTETKVIRLTTDQEAVLQAQFNRWPKNPHKADVVLLAAETGLTEEDVQDWYTYKLAQLRKEQGLGGFGIGSNY
ncbi:hypothetical protein QAD02_022090, partial [Eretmocerus hayati]